jgi:hypothetical protein
MKRLFGSFVFTCMLTGFAVAADLPSTEEDPIADYTCGTKVPGAKADIVAAGSESVWSSASGPADHAIVVWEKSGPYPTVKVAARTAGTKWRALAIQSGASLQGGFATPAGQILLFTMHTVEGPGGSYVVMSSSNDGQDFQCSAVAFPKALNNPTYRNEYLELEGYQGTVKGEGTLFTRSVFEDTNTGIAKFYSYTTHDGGKTWGEPVALSQLPASGPSDFVELKKGVEKTLLDVMPDTF